MIRVNLGAHTPPEGVYPPYISINAVTDIMAGERHVEIIVRSPDTGGSAFITMTRAEFVTLVAGALHNLGVIDQNDVDRMNRRAS